MTPWLPVAIAVVMASLLLSQVDGVNGPSYFPWSWQHLDPIGTLMIAGLAVGHLLVIGWALKHERQLWIAVSVIGLSSALLRLGATAVVSDPPGLSLAASLVEDPSIGSFFSFAQRLKRATWSFEEFPQLLKSPDLELHAINKPPGPTMYWYAFLGDGSDPDRAAERGIVVLAILSAAAVPLMAAMVRALELSDAVALHAAALLSMMPGAIVFFPMFDPALTTITLGVAALWFMAIRRGSIGWSIAFGVALAGMLFAAFHLMAIGLYLAAAGWVASKRKPMFFRAAAVAVVTCIAVLAAMKLILGYDTLATFSSAMEGQRLIMEHFAAARRPYPITIPWDLSDFTLGVGYVPIVLAFMLLLRSKSDRKLAAISWCGVGVLLVVAVGGLLPGETSRVWNFLFPLAALPAAGAIAAMRGRDALLTYAAMGLVLVTIIHSLTFMKVLPVIH